MPGCDLSNLSLIVIEPHAYMRVLLRDVMRALGVTRIRTCASPEEAFEEVKRDCPDLVVSDWSPKVDAIYFLTLVRRAPSSPNRFLPVIVLSAYTEAEHVGLARDAGMTEFLAKPFTAKLIFTRIKAVVERGRVFVDARSFFGPDRRRHAVVRSAQERRRRSPRMVAGAGLAIADARASRRA